MTREERVVKLAELRAIAEESVALYNDAMQNSRFEEVAKIGNTIEETVNEYTAVARDMCFEDCKNTDDPMLAAIKTLFFATISVKDEKKGEDLVPIRVIVEKDRPIDLLKLDKYCGGIGADGDWSHIAMKMNFLLTAQKCVDLGVNPKTVNDSYAMSKIAEDFDMGKSPTSKTNLLKTLQTVITAMLGEGYKATSHDVNFLMSIYSRKNRQALKVSCANHRNFRNYIAEICHRIAAGKSYEVEYTMKKDA